MCPMRIFLVLFSSLLAGYLAWRNFSQSEKLSIFDVSEEKTQDSVEIVNEKGTTRQIYSKVSSGFWCFVDMASGRYLWKNLRSSAHQEEASTR